MATRTKKRKTVVEVTHLVELDREDLLRAARVPKDSWKTAKVFVRVPSGGDYSGEILDVDGACPATVLWTRTTEKTDDAGDEPEVDVEEPGE